MRTALIVELLLGGAVLLAYVLIEKRVNQRRCPACGQSAALADHVEMCPRCGSPIK